MPIVSAAERKESREQWMSLLKNCMQSAVIAGFGTSITEIIKGNEIVDVREILIMMLLNFMFITPVLLAFYSFLGSVNGGTLKKLLIDQLLFCPMLTASIIGLRLVLIGTSINKVIPLVIEVMPEAMKSTWLFWIPQRFLTLTFVDPKHHLLANNLSALVWNVIFSMIISAQQ